MMFRAIHRHYERAAGELAAQTPLESGRDRAHRDRADRRGQPRRAADAGLRPLDLADNVTAVHITDDEAEIEQMREEWKALGTDIPLVIIESPYRALVGPLLAYLDEIDQQRPDDTITVVLPEFIARHWWEQILHNQTALRIKAALLFRPGTVVTSVPYTWSSEERNADPGHPPNRPLLPSSRESRLPPPISPAPRARKGWV